MTIKEIEARSGMTRANIRFYEAEGLLSPARSGNGYRDYTEDDLEELKRIRLLRTLRLSLEEIRALQTGEEALSAVLERRIAQLDRESGALRCAQSVCREMRADGVDYPTLDAQRYLDAYDRPTVAPRPAVPRPSPLAEDVLPPVRAPWRRLFARLLDLWLYTVLWNSFLVLAGNVNLSRLGMLPTLLNIFPPVALALLAEPLLLILTGTTAGKWIMGLRVTDPSGHRLRYTEALARTWLALRRGMGLCIPIYSLVRMWKSYRACWDGETLAWEEDTSLQLRDEKLWRGWALAGVFAVLVGLMGLAVTEGGMPRHRGDLTAAQYVGNYNRLAVYYGVEYDAPLTEDGSWAEPDGEAGLVLGMEMETPLPDFVLTETEGVLTGVGLSYETMQSAMLSADFQNEMTLAVLSLVCARPGFGAFSAARVELLEEIQSHPYESFSYTRGGVSVTCQVEYTGFYDTGASGILLPKEDGETSYSFHFAIALT